MASSKIPPPADMLNSLFHSQTDDRITRLSKILSTSAGVDSTLTLVGYSLALASTQLSTLQKLQLKLLGSSSTLKPSTASSITKLAHLETSMKLLAGLCSDFRTFMRLWGMLGVYAMAKGNYLKPPKDALLNAVSWTQTLALGSYYVCENAYYLAGKGVLHGWTGPEIKMWAKRSLRMFLAYVVLDFVRLYRSRQLLGVKKATAVDVKEKEDISKEEKVWVRTAVVDAAYVPLSLHWASEAGVLSEGWVGALMTFVGVVKFRAAWAASAA